MKEIEAEDEIEIIIDNWGITEEIVISTDTEANMIKLMDYFPLNFLHGE